MDRTFPFLLFLFVATGFAASAAADSRDGQMVAGLRERRLFELAEKYCQDRLQAPALDEITKAELTTELLRTFALHAFHESPAERAK